MTAAPLTLRRYVDRKSILWQDLLLLSIYYTGLIILVANTT